MAAHVWNASRANHSQVYFEAGPVWPSSASHSGVDFEAFAHMFCGHLVYLSGLTTHTSVALDHIPWLVWCIWVVVVSGWLVRISFFRDMRISRSFLQSYFNPDIPTLARIALLDHIGCIYCW